jgi:hypothetical protein
LAEGQPVLDLGDLRVFTKVVETESLTKAGLVLGDLVGGVCKGKAT